MKLGGFDSSGRKRPEPVFGSEFTLFADSVIAAVGQFPDTSFIDMKSEIRISDSECVIVGRGYESRTGNERYFAGGDAVTGPDTVIAAIRAGHQAAEDMDSAIRKANGEPAYREPEFEDIDVPLVIDEETVETPQIAMPELGCDKRRFKYRRLNSVLAKRML